VASVVKVYRKAIDKYIADPKNYKLNSKWIEELEKPSHRPYTTGFYLDEEVRQNYESSAYIQNYDMVGIVKDYNRDTNIARIQQRNKVYNGDLVEVLAIKGDNKILKLEDMRKENGEAIESANSPQMIFTVRCNQELKIGDILARKRIGNN
jgi:putative protease